MNVQTPIAGLVMPAGRGPHYAGAWHAARDVAMDLTIARADCRGELIACNQAPTIHASPKHSAR